jgi:hypothetical protein
MAIEDHPKYDDSGKYNISDKHLMVFSHHDGFTERLLNVTLFVTKSLTLEIYLKSFKKGADYGQFTYENVTQGIPKEIAAFLDELPKLDTLDFGYNNNNVDNEYLTDMQMQEFVFNHNGKTAGFCASGGMSLSIDHFGTDLGKRFYSLQLFINEWQEKLYADFNAGEL